MNLLYTLLLYIGLPIVLLRLLVRGLKVPEYRRRWGERFGQVSFHGLDAKETIWIHSVSVGETQAAEPMVRRLMEMYPGLPILITTTTPTGSDRVANLFGKSVYHAYFPYDLPFAINAFLTAANPCMLVTIETEIWPNLLAVCKRNGIPTVLANARLSEKSAKGYARFGVFSRRTFNNISVVAAQTAADAERFLGLGMPKERVRVTGSIKFDIRLPASLHEQADVIRRQLAARPVWVAASTHEGEDELVLLAHHRIIAQQPDALLVLVPRHPERFDKVAALCGKMGFEVVRRSANEEITPDTTVFLGDTMGELTLFLAATDAAFVGGSFVPTGGHNVLEPAALGMPVVFGPHMFNFEMISRMLLAEDAAVQVDSADALAGVIARWLTDASERTRVGENGRAVVEANRGALDRLLDIIDEQLSR